MIKGLYSAVSAMVANVNRQQVLTHNISNMDTPGFKQILTSLRDFAYTTVYHPPADESITHPAAQVGLLGLGTNNGPDIDDYSQGGLQFTGNELDMAIEGNGFFRVRTPAGERYTRDGRFIRDAQSNLVTADGYRVLNASGQPIKLQQGTVYVASDGTLSVDGQAAGKLGLAAFRSPTTELTRDGDNLFKGKPSGGSPGRVAQEYLEMSNANPTQLMTQLVEVSRSYEAAQQMVANEDELLGKAISSLGHLG